jgi:hypothetical protein
MPTLEWDKGQDDPERALPSDFQGHRLGLYHGRTWVSRCGRARIERRKFNRSPAFHVLMLDGQLVTERVSSRGYWESPRLADAKQHADKRLAGEVGHAPL